MRKFTFLKMMLLAVVMLAGSMSMTAQTESVIYSFIGLGEPPRSIIRAFPNSTSIQSSLIMQLIPR